MNPLHLVFLVISASGVLAGCVNGTCRQLKRPELAQATSSDGTKSAVDTDRSDKTKTVDSPKSPSPFDGRVLVYQADGSLQCAMAKGLPLAEMEKQLGNIKVYSRDKRPDGRMHIQVCGSPTGIVNVYEIPASSEKDAEKRGFKKLEP